MGRHCIKAMFFENDSRWLRCFDDETLFTFIHTIDGEWSEYLKTFTREEQYINFTYPLWEALNVGSFKQVQMLIDGKHPVNVFDKWRQKHILTACMTLEKYKLMIDSGAPCIFDRAYLPDNFCYISSGFIEYVLSRTTSPVDRLSVEFAIYETARRVVQWVWDGDDQQTHYELLIERVKLIFLLASHLPKPQSEQLTHNLIDFINHESKFEDITPCIHQLTVYLSFAGLLPISCINFGKAPFISHISLYYQSFVEALLEQKDIFE